MRSNLRSGGGRTSRVMVGAAAVMSLAVLSACSGGGSGSDTAKAPAGGTTDASGKANVTLWTWTPGSAESVAMFEKAHPNIKVKLVNAGQGAAEYTKLRTALKAGSGAPDVVQVEYQFIPSFTITKNLVDLNKYGADKIKGDYASWVWTQASQNGAVYGIPQDTGPMALMYRADIFKKYGITVPKTWDEFATAAAKLHAAAPNVSMTNLPPNDSGQLMALMAQAGSRPHKIEDQQTVSLNFANPEAKKWAAYWQDLNKKNLITTDPDFNDQWYKGFSSGRYATWLAAAWGPTFLQGIAKNTSGKWRVAQLPQWNAGDNVSANWGGSTLAVTNQAKNPSAAAQVAMWMNHDPGSMKSFAEKFFLFPPLNSVQKSPSYSDQKVAFFGGQQVNQLYAKASDEVAKNFTWSPFQDYIYTQMTGIMGKALTSKGDLVGSLDQVQTAVSGFAKSQGFTVKTG